MSEHDNDNLERFFSKAAREPHVEFNENDWRKLEARLDAKAFKASSNRPNRWRSGVAAVGIILFFTGITYFLLPGRGHHELTNSAKNSRLEATPENKIAKIADSLGEATPGITSRHENQIASVKKNKSDAKIKPFPVERAIGNSNPGSQDHPYQHIETKKHAEENVLQAIPDGIPPQEVLENKPTDPNVAEAKGYSPALPLTSKEDSTNRLLLEKGSPDVRKTEIKASTDSIAKSQTTTPVRWSIVLSFAPDFSSTGSNQYTSPGVAFGLAAHYHLSNSFSIATGLVRSRKQYWSYGNEYQPPKGYWKRNTNGVIPESIYGTCNVLEIPLALQYKVAKMKRSRMFITAGLSSYVMLNESSYFTFENPNPGAKEEWNSRGTSRFLFSLANVSAGYERDVLPNVAIGIEPYVKIPLTGIGWSDIKLLSMGASVTLRYSIRKKTN
jgi:hypothetical protein